MSRESAERIVANTKEMYPDDWQERLFPFVLSAKLKAAEKDSTLWDTDPVLVAAFGPHTNC